MSPIAWLNKVFHRKSSSPRALATFYIDLSVSASHPKYQVTSQLRKDVGGDFHTWADDALLMNSCLARGHWYSNVPYRGYMLGTYDVNLKTGAVTVERYPTREEY